ncbi:uncharacterized protein K452DRAFT_231304 [Aplosporella prunicola CBS 121167]|uniref:RING-type domain-containing protein n=1 Tax=Aplosporella prunicola CBS 121167 TaxID=1176127 RepID=A0A6A6B6X7_9PEZI|nr:uncharacterized protein K452DRAFT_231304 [Aplosporella prunicola CBS 121167]KAF2139892.1 hypothetical protein K452DRAFT_231304 [Aplosporella prunicola CBS 121167]
MPDSNKSSTPVVAIVLPTLFAIVLVIIIATTAIFLPRLLGKERSDKEECQKKRMHNLEKACKSQIFEKWCSEHESQHPEYKSQHPICTICLETIEDMAHIRNLGCQHVFHQDCLDNWFSRFNEFCPLCHRPILPRLNSKDSKTSVETGHDSAIAGMV